MSAGSGLVGKKSSRAHLGPSGHIFCVGRKNRKNAEILLIFLGGPPVESPLFNYRLPDEEFVFCLFSLMGQWALFTRFGEMVAIFLLPSVSAQ